MGPILVSLLSGLLVASCSQSPLLNHKKAEEIKKGQGGSNGKKEGSPSSPAGASGGQGTPRRNTGPGTNRCPLAFNKVGLCASAEWVREPPGALQEGEFKIYLWDKKHSSEAGPYVDLATRNAWVDVHLWMPDHGHGSSKAKVRAARDAQGVVLTGIYHATQVIFSMEGSWDVWIQLKPGDSSQQELQDQGNHNVILDQAKWTYLASP